MSSGDSQKQAEQVTGVSNVAYNVMGVLYNTLEGISAMEDYKEDAQEAGDQEVYDVFEQIQQRLQGDVERLRQLLSQRL